MPVLELTQLRLKGVAADDPSLLKSLSLVRGKLQTSSQFYSCLEDPSLIYILGLWPSLASHHDFLASPTAAEVLGPQDDMLEFKWTLHMELDAMSSLPLDAPVLSIARLFVLAECVDSFDKAIRKDRQLLVQGTHPYRVAHGWRCDAPPGKHEALMFAGWETMQAHADFAAKQKGSIDYPAIHGKYEDIQLHHARNLEGKDK